MMRRRRFVALPFLPVLAASGCGIGREVVLEPASGTGWVPPLVEPLPLRLSYVFEPSVDQEVTFRAGPTSQPTGIYHLRLGPATRAIFERTLPALVTDARAGTPVPGEDGSLVIALLRAHATDLPEIAASVGYGITFHDPDGADIGTWKLSGSSIEGDTAEVALALALRNSTAELVRLFPVQPAIVGWLAAGREATS